MVKKGLRVATLMLVILALLTSSVLAVTGTVTGSTVRIREKASSNSPEVSAATKGEKVEIIGEEGNWYQVKFEKVTGYISKDYVDTDEAVTTTTTPEPEPEPAAPEPESPVVEEPEPEQPEQAQEPEVPETTEPVTTVETPNYEESQIITFEHDTNLRYLPTFSSRVNGTATSGATYTVKASLNNWVKVVNETGSGWVLKNAIEGSVVDTPVTPSVDENNAPSLDETPNTEVEVSKGKVNVDSARIRKSPDGEILESLKQGTEVTILGEEDGWYRISTEKYESCYIAKRLITEN